MSTVRNDAEYRANSAGICFLPHLKRVVRVVVTPAFPIRSIGQTRAPTMGPSLQLQYLGQ